jgi:GT2 family glycosyltransferase
MKTFVSAIVISHDSPEFLSRTIAALEQQPIDELIHVETSSSATKFPKTLELANASLSKSLALAASKTSAESNWLWILHDDSAPLPGALQAMLAIAETSPSVALIGAKQVDYNDERVIVQQGLTLTRRGGLFSLVSTELDQSQHDSASDVLAVGTAGMLVKREVWLALGGLDDSVAPLAADIDFSMRVRALGHRVVVAPQAKVAHAQLSLEGKRDRSWLGSSPKTALRKAELQLRLSWSPLWLALGFWLLLPLITLVRMVWRIWAKRPDRLLGEMAAAIWAQFTIFARMRARRSLSRSARAAMASLYATKQQVRDDRRRNLEQDEIEARLEAHAALAERDQLDSASPNTEQLLLGAVSTSKSFVASRGLWFVAGLLALSFAYWPVDVAITGGSTIPLSQNWFELFRRAGASWHPIGHGFIAPSDPFVWVLTLLGSLTFWSPSLSVAILFFVAKPIAFYGAFKAASVFTTKAWLRNIVALTFALSPALIEAQQELRLPALISILTLPYLVFTVSRVALLGKEISVRSRQQTFTWVGLAALLLAIETASAPNTILLAVAALLVVFLIRPRRFGYLIWIGLPMTAIFAPLFVYLVILSGKPLAIFADPALALATNDSPAWRYLSGALGQSVWWPISFALAVTGLIVAAFALIGLLSRQSKSVAGLLGFAALALGFAWLFGHTNFAAVGIGPASADFVNGSPQALLGIWSLALLLAVATWVDSLAKRSVTRLVAVALTFLVAIPAAAVAAISQPDAAWSSARVMPALIDAQASAGSKAQVLVISPDKDSSGFSAAWIPVGGIQLEDTSVAYRFALADIEKNDRDYANVAQLVADLVSASGAGVDEALAKYSIGYVLVPSAKSQTESNQNAQLAVSLNSVAQLESAGETDFGKIWRVRNFASKPSAEATSPWSITKAVELAILLGFVLLAIPSAGRRRAAATSEIFVDSGDGND